MTKKASDKNVMIEKILETTDRVFEDHNITKKETGVYIGSDVFDVMVAVGILFKQEWFKAFVSKWLWYEDNEVPVDLIKKFELSV